MTQMSQAIAAPVPVSIPVRQIIPWAAFAGAVALVLLYIVGVDQGATSLFGNNMLIHEFVHDARHLAGLPCH
jgi:hypothetical protein